MNIETMTPFAFAVAEAVADRTAWLDLIKKARRNPSITHQEYSCTEVAYKRAKVRAREALAAYVRARKESANGGTPVLSDETKEHLRKYGITF